MNIIIEEIVVNPLIQIEEVTDDVTISVQEIVEQYSISIEEIGLKGDKGDTGLQGIQGLKGDKGDTGSQGIQGIKGDKGDTGSQGIQGIKGDKGDTGSQGIQGEIGLTGLQGIQGIQGIKGDVGLQGEQGIQGIQGEIGLTGSQGIQGEIGLTGLQGIKGDVGLQGIQGEIGLTGKSAYQSALDGGFVGTELEFNTFLSEVDKLDNISGTNTGDQDLSGKQNTLTNPLTGVGSELNPNTYALQDGTILYHSAKWFVPSGAVSTIGATVTSVGTQFTSAMVGAKLIINGEWRIITAYTNATNVTVESAYSQNYSGVVAGSWGVYSKSYESASTGVTRLINNVGTQRLILSGNTVSSFNFTSGGGGYSLFDANVQFGATTPIQWGSGGFFTTKDLGLRRNKVGVLEIYDGITPTGLEANRRDLLVRKITTSQIEINSTTQGFLPPRMTNAQRIAIASPAIGSVVYCTDATEGLYVNKSTGWTLLL